MKKKVAMIAATVLFTTATIVAATSVNNGKKPVKTAVAKEKKARCTYERTHCFD